MLLKEMHRFDDRYISCRAGVDDDIRRVPYGVRQHYAAKRQNQRWFYLLTSGIKPRGAKRSVNKRTSPMVMRRV